MSIARRLALATFIASGAVPLTAKAGTFTTLYSFTGNTDGGSPSGPLTYSISDLYGTTDWGHGNVFKLGSKTGNFKVFYKFKGGSDGEKPTGGVIYQPGIFYGTTEAGGGTGCAIDHPSGCGTIYTLNRAGVEKVLYVFSQDANSSRTMPAGLWATCCTTVYGITRSGGTNGNGSVFTFDEANLGSFATIVNFDGLNGSFPNPSLFYKDGFLYGTTADGGPNCHSRRGFCGVVFSVNLTTNAGSVVHAFSASKNGRIPDTNLTSGGFRKPESPLIGGTQEGGDKTSCKLGCGVIFKIKATSGHETVLSTLASGDQSVSGVTQVGDDVFETLPTGAGGYGELLEVNLKTGQQTVLYTFTGGVDGSTPIAPLTYANGVFYGATVAGGNVGCFHGNGCGTVFKYVP